jgi:hypothetical protein
MDKATIDIGKKEFCAGLAFVAISCLRHPTDLILSPPFTLKRLQNSCRLIERKNEETRQYIFWKSQPYRILTNTSESIDICTSTIS